MERAHDWSHGLVSRWVKTSPSVDKVVDVIRYLGVRYEDILGELHEEDHKNKSSGADAAEYENVIDKLICIQGRRNWHARVWG